MTWLAIEEPGMQAFILRLIHASFNVFSLVIGYRLALLAGGVRGARLSFALLALSWLMPFISVRTFSFNLALPFLLGAVWIARYSLFSMKRASFIAGFVASISILLYPPILVFWLPYVFITLFLGKPIRFFALILSTILGIEIIHLLVSHSFLINLSEWNSFIQMTGIRPWQVNFQALRALVILGLVLGPPLGFFVIYGFLRLQRFTIRMSVPALVCVVGSIFSVDPIGMLVAAFPFIVITGSQSWMEVVEKHLKPSRQIIYYLTVGYFWIFNILLLVWFSTVAPHKQEIDFMRYLGKKAGYQTVWVEQTSQPNSQPLPRFYCSQKLSIDYLRNADKLPAIVDSSNLMHKTAWVIFRGEENLKNRLLNVYNLFPALSFEAIFRPGITERYFRQFMGLPSGTLILYYNDYYKNSSIP
ncbi:MAG: hypothetical protein WHT22_11080 [Bacteroidales bacterium]|jgi:hypothetical protein|nr:hypothetical protein [Bacteroidales bacterium]